MKKLKAQKGITLIALIITIIILLILAVVVIGNLQDRDLLKYAQKSATDYNKSKENEIAILDGYEGVMEEITNEDSKDGETEVIPEGGVYTAADGTVYVAGQNFPVTVTVGDVYAFGDYEYCYNYLWNGLKWLVNTNTEYEGWGVRVQDKTKTEYGTIITSINKKNVTCMCATFMSCSNLVIPPAIPSGVTTINSAFYECTSLTTMPDMSKATNLSNMGESFSGCTALKTVTAIPNSVGNMDYTFKDCTSLETAPAIPEGVTDMSYTFRNCTSLTGEIEINANPTEYYRCFDETTKNIKIIGSASTETKAALAGTSNGNVTY